MAKQLNIDLNFNANTEKAKQAILDLQQSLANIAKMPGKASSLFDDRDIRKASEAALDLQRHLEKAVNVKTGKLDLSRFSLSLKASGKDLNKYYDNLLKIGPAGQQAFLQMAQAVATAETPIVRVNKKLVEMGTVLKNTVRWQISSSILHGFMGSVQKAYGYAKDLNESLNNIRIVTGQSADQMSKFAIEANRAAKELSTTTNEYAKASLIYYQQGLNDSDVKARTDITIKMANVARESAETVSDQMTAVWNNFYDGSASLESFADKMTALGAATASSTSEISEGLNKFAGIADTVGLSFDYASAALATVTATSRQSADIVGTAFKTMFARIQGLKLGETLDDGTTLNKYSEALMKVGVNIKDSNGQLKDMDTILSEMASKWKSMEKDRQVALAQTVAGTRQYTQLVTLMDNWDFMEENLKVVEDSNGALAEQQAIYEQGWEAARDRVRAASEAIYSDLLDDDFFISISNGLANLLDTIHGVTDGLGGMQGVLTFIGSIFMNLYAKKIPAAMENLKANFMIFSGHGITEMQKVQDMTNQRLVAMQKDTDLSESFRIQALGAEQVSEMQKKLIASSKLLTDQEKESYEAKIKNVQAMYDEAAAIAKVKEEKEKLYEETKKSMIDTAKNNATQVFRDYSNAEQNASILEKKVVSAQSGSDEEKTYLEAYNKQIQKAAELEVAVQRVSDAYGISKKSLDTFMTSDNFSSVSGVFDEINKKVNQVSEEFSKLTTQNINLDGIRTSLNSQAEEWNKNAKAISGNKKETNETKKAMIEYLSVIDQAGKDNQLKFNKGLSRYIRKLKEEIQDLPLEEAAAKVDKFAQTFDKMANGKIVDLDQQLENLREELLNLGFKPEAINNLEKAAGSAAEKFNILNTVLDNVKREANQDPPVIFKASEAFGQFASAAMSVYSLINSITGAIKTFGDESASTLQKVGAAVSILMSATMTYSSVSRLASVLVKKDTIAKWALGKANHAAALSTEELSAAAGKLSIKIAIAMAVITAVIALLDWLIVTSAEATENIKKANEAVEETKKELESLTDELKTIQDKIKEINQKDKLTITDEKELARLQAQEASLKNQIILQEQLNAKAKKEQIDEFEKNGLQMFDRPVAHNVNNEYYNTSDDFYDKFITPNSHIDEKTGKRVANEGYNQKLLDYYLGEYEEFVQRERENYQEQAEKFPEFQEAFSTWYDANKNSRPDEEMQPYIDYYNYVAKNMYGEDYSKILKNYDKAFSNSSNYSGIVKKLTEDNKDGKIETTAAEIANLFSKEFKDTLIKQGILPEDFAQHVIDDISQGVKIDESVQKSLARTREELVKIQDIASKIKLGSIITVKDYQTLTDFNSELAKYFTILSDGSAQFSGDPLDFQQLIKQQSRKELIKAKNEAEEATSTKQKELNDLIDSQVVADSSADFQRRTGVSDPNAYKAWADTQLRIKEDKKVNDENVKMQEVQEAQAHEQAINNEIALGADDYNERQSLLQNGTINQDAYAKAAETAINQEAWEGLKPEEIQEYSDYLEDTFGIAEEGAEEVARSVTKMNKGVESLKSNWEEWGSILKKSSKDSEEYAKAMQGTKHALSDVLDVSEDFIDADWIESADNMALIEKAAKGDAEAIDALGKSLAEDIAFDKLEEFDPNHIFNIEGVEYNLTSMKELFSNTLDDMLTNLSDAKLNPGDSLDNTSLIAKLNEMVAATGMSVEEANAMYRSMGFTPHFKRTPITADSIVPVTTKHHHRQYIGGPDEYGNMTDWIDTEYTTTEEKPAGETKLTALTMATEAGDYRPTVPTPQIEGATYTGGGSMNNHSSSNKGGKKSGGGGSKKKAKKSNLDIERYKEVNDALKTNNDLLQEANDAMDDLYGANRLSKMDEAIGYLEKEIALNETKLKQAKEYLKMDKKALQESAANAGINFEFDKNGNITNYTTEMVRKKAEHDALVDAANADGYLSDEESKKIEESEKALEDVDKKVGKYDETKETITDLEKEKKDEIRRLREKEFDKINYKLQLKLELNEEDLKDIDFKLKMIEDDFYKSAEGAALLGSKFDPLTSNLQARTDAIDAINKKYAEGRISQEKYMQLMKEQREGIYSDLEALKEMDKAMGEYYGKTLAAAGEEIAKYTDKMDHCTDVLDHFYNIMELTGQSTDFEKMGTILKGQSKTISNSLEISKKEYEIHKKDAEDFRKALQADPDNKVLQNNLEEAEKKVQESQAKILENTEKFLENANAILENDLKKFQKELEKTLTNGSSFEIMNKNLERANTLQEDFLTTTNKIYETNKLIRKAQDDFDKTTNKRAKERIKAFMKETKSLQDKGKLSKFELEIQQEKYNLLLAEMELEEAKNAQSKVRLTRDSEGNFNYVYTADEDKINEAQQKYDDANNSIYNKSLNAANDFSSKYQQTLQSMWEEIGELNEQRRQGEIDEEEYDTRKLELKKYYFEQLKNYSELYQQTLYADSRIIDGIWLGSQQLMLDANDIWHESADGMNEKNKEWTENIEENFLKVEDAFTSWQETVDNVVTPIVGEDLEGLKTNVDSVTNSSDALKTELEEKVLPAVEKTLDQTKEEIITYSKLSGEVETLIDQYSKYAEQLKEPLKVAFDVPEEIPLPEIPKIEIPYTYVPTNSIPDASNQDSGKGNENQGQKSEKNPPLGGNEETTIAVSDKGMKAVSRFELPLEGHSGQEFIDKNGQIWHFNASSREWELQRPLSAKGFMEKRPMWTPAGREYEYQGFDTGGYTGKWGPEGKLAVLHEKEIVLNKEDTSNLLHIVDMTDKIINTINLNAQAASMGLGSITPGPLAMGSGELNQNVTITADFPNVIEHSEIEEAFNNLINEAAQYANRIVR